MQVIPRWRNLLLFKNSTHLASFHSTPTSFKKWNSDVKGQQSSKSYIRYETRQKRADAKKALNNLLFSSGCSKITFEEVQKTEDKNTWDGGQGDHSDSVHKKCRSKSSARHATRTRNNERKLKYRRDCYFEDFEERPEISYEATVRNRFCTWSFKSWGKSSFQSSTSGFEWREHPNWTNGRNKAWGTASETKSTNGRNKEWDTASKTWSDGKSYLGSFSDRKLLGLPLKGPLKIEEVKTAFRLSALKWHPDKHQGSSQAMAEEKFKYCVDAYKSLCNALASS